MPIRNYQRRSLLRTIVTTGIGLGAIGTGSANARAEPDDEQYIVLAGGSNQRSRLESAGYEVLHDLADGSVFIVQGPEGKEDELQSIPAVSSAVANRTYTVDTTEPEADDRAATVDSDTLSSEQWAMERTRAFEAHDIATGDRTTIAVIDTGIDHTHPDLAPQLDRDRSRLFRNGTVHSGTAPINVATELEPVERFVGTDVDGHGSHVAGIAAAPRNETGIVGVAPDATLVSLRPFFFENPEDGLFSLSSTVVDLLVAIDYAVEIGVDVINISLSAGDPDPGSVARRRMYAAFNRIVEYAIECGTSVVAAMGNAEMGNDPINTDQFPGYILPASNPGTISVAAVDEDDVRYQESHFGDSTVTVAAPGDQILSTVPDELFWNQYQSIPGTSAAAPQVAGLACLLRELEPNLHPRAITQAIQQGAVDLSGDGTSGLGAGRIDALETVSYLR